MWRYWAFKAALGLARPLPRTLGYRLAALGGELYYWLNPRHSHRAVENYAIVLADDPRAPRVRDAARRSFRNYGKTLFDFLRLSHLDPDAIESDTFITGFEHLDAALAGGRGVLLVTLHFGNWDLAAALVAARGYPVSTLADRFTPPALDRLIAATRERAGLGIIPLDRGDKHGHGLRRVARALRRGQVVALLIDRPQREGGVEVEFFGARAWLPSGPARFALRSGAPVLPCYLLRRPGDRTYLGAIEPPIPFVPSGDEGADVRALTQAIVERLEGPLRQYPDQWYMFRQMWP